MNETENQAVDAFVSAFENEASKIGLPKKIAACGAIFTIGAHFGMGIKILLVAPPFSGKSTLLRSFIVPVSGCMSMYLYAEDPEGLTDLLSEYDAEGKKALALSGVDGLEKGCDRVLAEWDGGVLVCETLRDLSMPFSGFDRVDVSDEEGKRGNAPPRGGNKPDISGLRKRLGKLPAVEGDSLIERVRKL